MTRSKTDTAEYFFEEKGFQRAVKTVEFDGSAGKGMKHSPVNIFDVTGEVMVKNIAFVTEGMAGGTIEVGVPGKGSSASILPQREQFQLGTSYIWGTAGTGTVFTFIDNSQSCNVLVSQILGSSLDIVASVTGTAITNGTIKFVCFWRPITEDSSVIPY
jgi:hypothetical protein